MLFSLVHALPSSASAVGIPFGPPPLFGWFIGTMAQSDPSVPFMLVVQPLVFTSRSAPLPCADSAEVSRFSCMKFPRRARGLRLRRAPYVLAIAHAWMLPSPSPNKVGAPDCVFEAQYPAHQCLCLRFVPCLAASYAKLEVRMVRYSFPVRLFHSLLHAGLSRRSGCPGFFSLLLVWKKEEWVSMLSMLFHGCPCFLFLGVHAFPCFYAFSFHALCFSHHILPWIRHLHGSSAISALHLDIHEYSGIMPI